MEQQTQAIKMPKKLEQYIGVSRGSMAPGDRIPVDTEMDETQRDLQISQIWKYIEKSQGVDWNLFGYATAVRYTDGTLKLINGQHRIELVKYFLPDITEVPAHIINTDDPRYAARLFAGMNGTASRSLSSDQIFWAETIAEEPEALFLKEVLEKANLQCGKVNANKKRKKVKYANFKYAVGLGVDETIRAAELIDAAYSKYGMNDTLLSGMARLFSHSSYRDMLMDPEHQMYNDFENWFVNILPQTHPITELGFRQYRNTHKWSDGVAYGLYQKFAYYQRHVNRYHYPIEPIKKVYEAGVKTKVDDYEYA